MGNWFKNSLIIFFSCFMLSSCQDNTFKEDVVFAGGQYVSAKTLNMGQGIYTEYCMPCHGVKGDGKGLSNKGMQVPPRDFTLGIYKFGQVVAGDLPHDEDFNKIINYGLKGTAMLPWDLGKEQLHAVISYIKMFAADKWVGADKKLGVRILPENDPYGLAHKTSAIKRGKEVYHVEAICQSCHIAYVSKRELSMMSKRLTGDPVDDFTDIYEIKTQDSDHGGKTLPPDFTWNEVRSGTSINELYVRIASGVGGTAMPAWKDTLEDDDIWAVAYYVQSLIKLKDSSERHQFMDQLKNQ